MAQILCGDGLAGAADIVALALDGHQRGTGDRARIDPVAMHLEAAMRQILALEHALEGLQIELGRQIHHGAVFVVKRAGRRRAVIIALDQLLGIDPAVVSARQTLLAGEPIYMAISPGRDAGRETVIIAFVEPRRHNTDLETLFMQGPFVGLIDIQAVIKGLP